MNDGFLYDCRRFRVIHVYNGSVVIRVGFIIHRHLVYHCPNCSGFDLCGHMKLHPEKVKYNAILYMLQGLYVAVTLQYSFFH